MGNQSEEGPNGISVFPALTELINTLPEESHVGSLADATQANLKENDDNSPELNDSSYDDSMLLSLSELYL